MRKLILIFSICTFAWLGLGGCGDDCPTCPKDEPAKPYKGWLYYTDLLPTGYNLMRVDMETDSITDSLDFEGDALPVGVSPDGAFLLVGHYGVEPQVSGTVVLDAQTMAVVKVLEPSMIPIFLPGDTIMVGFGGYYVHFFEVPSFELFEIDTLEVQFSPQALDKPKNRVLGFTSVAGPLLVPRYYDLFTHSLSDSLILTNQSELEATIYGVCFNRSFTRLYYRALFPSGPSVGCYDLENKSIVWDHRTGSQFGGLAVSPDESKVYMTDRGANGDMFNSGTIFILDASTGVFENGISLYGYHQNPYLPLAGGEIIFSPFGEKAYVATGHFINKGPGSILVVDTKQRVISKVLSPELDRIPFMMAIGPKK